MAGGEKKKTKHTTETRSCENGSGERTMTDGERDTQSADD